YIIWAQEPKRALAFYRSVFDAEIVRESDVMADIQVAGSTIGIHGGGEGKRTWTGLAFQVRNLAEACDAIKAAGGTVLRGVQDSSEEQAHRAMCVDSEGNEIMVTVPRH